MITTIISDFSYVILFPVDASYSGTLNEMYSELLEGGDFDYLEYYSFNDDLLAYYKELSENYSVNIFTSGKVQMHPVALQRTAGIFDNTISAMKYDMMKSNPAVYPLMLEELGVSPEEVIFIDDSLKNIEAAKESGIKGIQYKDNESLKAELTPFLSSSSTS